MTKRFIQEFLRIGISGGCIVGAIVILRDKLNAHEAFELLRGMNWAMFSLVFLIFFVINFIASVRLSVVLRIQSVVIHFFRVVYFNLVGLFFNLFLPSQLGGDAVKAYYLSKDSGTTIRTISSILMDRIFGLAAVISVAIIALPFFMQSMTDARLVNSVFLMGVSFLIVVVIFFNENLANRFRFLKNLIPTNVAKQKVSQFYHVVAECRQHMGKVMLCYGISLVMQLMMIYIGYLISNAIGLNIPYMVFMLILPVTAVIAMLPSLGGLGVREASVIYFVSNYTTTEGATAFALAFDILIYGVGLMCGILYLIFGGKLKLKDVTVETK